MKRPLNYILFIIICLISYFFISNVLFQIDETPLWYEIEHPEVIVVGKPFEITVKYHNISIGYRLSAALILLNKKGQYQGSIRAGSPVRIIHGNGASLFKFIIPKNNSRGKDIHQVSIRLYRYELPKSANKSIYKGRRVGKPVSSKNIPVVKSMPDGSFPEIKTPSIWQIIYKALKEGYWITKRGDYSFEGWFITASYFLIFMLCLFYILKLRKNTISIDKTYIRFFFVTTVLIFILGINKQLDIQMLLADIGRTYSKAHGWYNTRRPFQVKFISIFASLAAGFVILAGYELRKIWQRILFPVAGLCMLFGFVIIKASSLHRFENFFAKKIAGFSMFGIFELIGLALIGMSAVNNLFKIKSGKVQSNNINDDKGYEECNNQN